jgi:hypothetical protein
MDANRKRQLESLESCFHYDLATFGLRGALSHRCLTCRFTHGFDLHQLTSVFVFEGKSNLKRHFPAISVHQGCYGIRVGTESRLVLSHGHWAFRPQMSRPLFCAIETRSIRMPIG